MTDLDQLLETLSKAPDGQIDHHITPIIKQMVGLPAKEVAEKLMVVRDNCVFSALASDFGMYVLNETIRIAQIEAAQV